MIWFSFTFEQTLTFMKCKIVQTRKMDENCLKQLFSYSMLSFACRVPKNKNETPSQWKSKTKERITTTITTQTNDELLGVIIIV